MNENEYVRHFTDLVELEREEQMRLHEAGYIIREAVEEASL